MRAVFCNLASFWYRMPREVSGIYETYKRHPNSKFNGGEMILSRLDAGVIYNLIRRSLPSHVLELGCGLGTGTAVVAMAMEANGFGRVTSLEHLEWMAELAWEMLPDAGRGRVEIVRCDLELRRYFDQDWTCYHFIPKAADVDLVIVDGPPTKWVDEAGKLHQSAHWGPRGVLALPAAGMPSIYRRAVVHCGGLQSPPGALLHDKQSAHGGLHDNATKGVPVSTHGVHPRVTGGHQRLLAVKV